MLMALNSKNQLIDADSIKSIEHENYICPSCRDNVFLKRGQKKAPHFSHYNKSDCNQFSEGETQEHIKGKRFLYNFLEHNVDSIQMEAFLPEINQRPDILISIGLQKIAIEFQCSPITVQKITERTKGYHSVGYQVIWILGSPIRLEKRLTQLHIAMMNQAILTTPNILQLDLNRKRVLIHFNFWKLNSVRWSSAILTQFCLNKTLPKNTASLDSNINSSIKKDIKLLKRMKYHKSYNSRPFFKSLYENGDHLYNLPKVIFYSCKWEWCIGTPGYEWKYYLLCWLESFQDKTIISIKLIQNWLYSQYKQNVIKISSMPNVPDNYGLISVCQFIKLLEKEGILKEVKPNYWVLVKHANRYNLTL